MQKIIIVAAYTVAGFQVLWSGIGAVTKITNPLSSLVIIVLFAFFLTLWALDSILSYVKKRATNIRDFSLNIILSAIVLLAALDFPQLLSGLPFWPPGKFILIAIWLGVVIVNTKLYMRPAIKPLDAILVTSTLPTSYELRELSKLIGSLDSLETKTTNFSFSPELGKRISEINDKFQTIDLNKPGECSPVFTKAIQDVLNRCDRELDVEIRKMVNSLPDIPEVTGDSMRGEIIKGLLKAEKAELVTILDAVLQNNGNK